MALAGFFYTKTEGFGRFTTSTLLVILLLIFSALFYAADKLPPEGLLNIFFALIA